MTIKELEQRTGMTRANIRFYEQEGLLSPARGANGYRDYSDADADALEKIKLLRRLHLDLESIRRLQSGALTLPEALAEQLKKLEQDQAALDRARQVCAQLARSGTDYAALDAQPWLEELDKAPDSERFAPPEDSSPDPGAHPWRRYFARTLDLALYGLPLTALGHLVFRLPPDLMNHWLFNIMESYLGIAIMFLLEPLMLHFWGATPGKAVFGIVLRSADGEKLTVSAARQRLWGVFSTGMGYGVPIYELWRMYKSYQACNEGELSWAFREDGRAERMDVPDSTARCWAYVGARAASVGLAVLITLQGQLPPRRGELDLAAFADNYNFYASYLGISMDPLGPDGEQQHPQNVVSIAIFPADVWRWSAMEAGGETVGFRWDMEYRGRFTTFSGAPQVLGLVSCAGAMEEVNCLNFRPGKWAEQIPDELNYDFTYRGLRVTQTVTVDGPRPELQTSDYIAFPEDQEGTISVTFTVQRA